MLLDELTLHNFGTYLARQTVTLAPKDANKPIVLFGGLNGAGKTTILDALQLCLYGRHAKCSGRKDLPYDDYLLQSISRGADVPEAAVEIAFRHMHEGREHSYRIHRSWSRSGKGCTERLEVVVDDRLDPLLTEHWAEQVEEFLPSRIAPLFLYDGEKIEAYADPRSSARMISTAVHNLLGLDLVEKLTSDLALLERRKRTEAKGAADRAKIARLEDEYTEIDKQRSALVQPKGELTNLIERTKKKLRQCEEQYRREGGALYDQRAELETGVKEAAAAHGDAERELREFVAGPAPLLLVQDLLASVAAADAEEAKTILSRDTAALLIERDRELLGAVEGWGLAYDFLDRLSAHLKADREAREAAVVDPVFCLPPEARAILTELRADVLPKTGKRLTALLAAEKAALRTLDDTSAAVAAIPTADALAAVVAKREELIKELNELEEKLRLTKAEEEMLNRELDRRGRELDRLRRDAAEEKLAADEVARVLACSEKVRGTLSRFRGEIVRRHVDRIETLVLESLKQLLRKESLVGAVRIDPDTFELELRGRDGAALPPERLSAGERQLLSVAILWGLARAAQRPLPTVIDTPLGRLDSTHRELLLKRYFPQASHQVILLSTDEEIFGRYYKALKPWIGRSYELEFDEVSSATTIKEGYFGGKAAHGH